MASCRGFHDTVLTIQCFVSLLWSLQEAATFQLILAADSSCDDMKRRCPGAAVNRANAGQVQRAPSPTLRQAGLQPCQGSADGLTHCGDAPLPRQLLFRQPQHEMPVSGGTTDQQTSTCRSPAYSVRNDKLVKDGGLDDRPVDFALLRDP